MVILMQAVGSSRCELCRSISLSSHEGSKPCLSPLTSFHLGANNTPVIKTPMPVSSSKSVLMKSHPALAPPFSLPAEVWQVWLSFCLFIRRVTHLSFCLFSHPLPPMPHSPDHHCGRVLPHHAQLLQGDQSTSDQVIACILYSIGILSSAQQKLIPPPNILKYYREINTLCSK